MKTHYLITTSLVAASLLAIQPVSARSVIGSSTYEGKTTVVTKNNDGTRTVSVTDANGKTTSTVNGKMPAGISVDDGNGGFKPYIPPAKSPVIGSSTYEGKTTVVTKNNDGTHTVSVTDANGKTTSTVNGKMPAGISVDDGNGGFKPYIPPAKSPVIGSSTYEGKTTVVTKNNDGTRTVSVTDANGKTTSTVNGKMPAGISVDDGNGGFKPYIPPAKSPVIGSSTYEGKTTVVTKNNDGTHTVSVTDANGKTTSTVNGKMPAGISVDDGNGGFKPYIPPAKSPVIGSSTYEGKTTVVTKNNDGTRTVSVTDANGKTTSTVNGKMPAGISVDDGNGGFKPYIPPAKSPVIGSSTYEGKTTVVTKNNDGTHTVSVTDANGKTTSTVNGKMPAGISVDDGNGGFKPYIPPAKSPVIGSSTYEGKTTVVTKNNDGTRTVSVTDAN